jgi:hypothetical protein
LILSVLDRHRFVADPDPHPDPNFHFDAYPYTDPTTSFTHVRKSVFFLLSVTGFPDNNVLPFSSVSKVS